MLPTLRRAREWTEAGIEVTLVDPQRWLYYSGMVPEFLGGVYDVEEIRIDLARLAREAGVQFVQETAAALDPDRRVVTTESGTEYSFDVLGIDVGAVNPAVPEAAVATKPIYRIRALEPHVRTVLDTSSAELRLVIVGAGAAGVEVAFNLTGRFQGVGRSADLDLTLVEQAERILPGFPEGMRRYAARRLRERGAAIQTDTSVEAVVRNGDSAAVQVTDAEETRSTLSAGAVLWATGTVGPSLLRDSGLSTDERGFLHTTPQLRTPTHPRIFAAGDCATIPALDLAKVGVHAVKQGTDLRANLDRTLQGLIQGGAVPASDELRRFRPYPVAPLILSTGTREGLWTAGRFWAAHSGLLRLKHWIDRRWIRTYAPDRWGGASWRTLLGAESALEPAG
jgi:selenide,water dikinase